MSRIRDTMAHEPLSMKEVRKFAPTVSFIMDSVYERPLARLADGRITGNSQDIKALVAECRKIGRV